MKLICTGLLLLTASASSLAAKPIEYPLGDPAPRVVRIGQKSFIDIARPGEIVVEPGNQVAAFAARELGRYLKESLGAAYAIVNAPSGRTPSIRLGGGDLKNVPGEGFVIKTLDRNTILIAGHDDKNVPIEARTKHPASALLCINRGTLTGVYDFLERFLGVRFYFPGPMGTVVPIHKALSLPEIDIVERPDHAQRQVSWWSGEWIPKLSNQDRGLNYFRLRLDSNRVVLGHGLSRYNLIERFGKTQPEYFTLRSDGRRYNDPTLPHTGQICFSSKVFDDVIKPDVKAFLAGATAASRNIKPEPWRDAKGWSVWSFQPNQVGLSPQDGFYCCVCPKCKVIYAKGDQAASTLVWSRIADIARYVQTLPGKNYVNNMAYHFFAAIPDCELPENMIISLAQVGPWAAHIAGTGDAEFAQLKAWRDKAKRKMILRNYALNGGVYAIAPEVPAMSPRAIGKYYKRTSPYASGGFLECESARYILYYLNYYMFSRVNWDASTDVEKLLEEHAQKMFGPAAAPMKQFFDRLEELWLGRVIGKTFDTPLGPQIARASLYELWEKIYTGEELARLDNLLKQAEKLAAKSPLELERIRFMRREMFMPIQQGAVAYRTNKNEIASWMLHGKTLAEGEKVEWDKVPGADLLPFHAKKQEVRTIVKAARDEKNLYFRFECEEPLRDKMAAKKRKFDDKECYQDSGVELFLNPSGDLGEYVQIMVNAAGSVADLKGRKIGGSGTMDWNFNSGVRAEVKPFAQGYALEVTVPVASLGVVKEAFPVNFTRTRALCGARCETKQYTWSPFLQGGFHEIERFGRLNFAPDARRNILSNQTFSAVPNGREFGGYLAGVWSVDNRTVGPAPGQVTLDRSSFMKDGQSIRLSAEKGTRMFLHHKLPELKPDTEYELAAYMRMENVEPTQAGGGVFFNFWDDKNYWYPKSGAYTGSMPWTRQVFRFRTSKITNRKYGAYFRLYMLNCKGDVWFDDVILREVSK